MRVATTDAIIRVMSMTQVVSVTSELPISAKRAFAAAQAMETMEYVMWPVFGMHVDAASIDRVLSKPHPGGLPIGIEFSARLVLFSVIPLWKHRLTVIKNENLELYTNEVSGPVRVWNHRLSFVPVGEASCRYTDRIEIESGMRGLGTKLFIKLFFRHRHRRWQKLAASLTD